MSMEVLSLKYRPRKMSEVIAQTVATTSIINAFKSKTLHNGYILAGKYGCVLGSTKITVRKVSEEGIHNIYTE